MQHVIARLPQQHIGPGHTQQLVFARASQQPVCATPAGDCIVLRIARTSEGHSPRIGQVFNEFELSGRQGQRGQTGLHRIGARVGIFHDGIGGRGKNIGIVPVSSGQRVIAKPAVQCICAGTAKQMINPATTFQTIIA